MGFWSAFADLVGTIPGTFWGVIVGSFFSIGAVMLSNRASDKRLQVQHDHERDLRIKDNELTLRKDIYLAAIEANFAGVVSIGKMADLEIPNIKVTEAYTEKSSAVAKVQVVGNEETIEAMSMVTNELAETFMNLFAKRVLLSSKKHEWEILNEQIASFDKERDRMIEAMKQYNLAGEVNVRLWQTITENYDFEQKRSTEAQEQRAKIMAELATKQFAFLKECVGEATRIGELSVPAVVAVRNELGLPLDEDRFKRIIEEGHAKITASTSQYIDQLQAFIDTELDSPENDDDVAPAG